MYHHTTIKILFLALITMCITHCQNLLFTGTSETPERKMKFNQFRHKYNRKYKDQSEELYRSLIVQQNSRKIDETNKLPTKGYSLKVNKFADLTELQFRNLYGTLYISNANVQKYAKLNGQKQSLKGKNCDCKIENLQGQIQLQNQIKKEEFAVQNVINKQRRMKKFMKDTEEKIRTAFQSSGQKLFQGKEWEALKSQVEQKLSSRQSSNLKENLQLNDQIIPIYHRRALTINDVDWSNYTGEVRVQGQCGACYAFAAVQNLEALLAIFTYGFVLELSVQQIIDCANNGLSFGCNGGFLEGPFNYLVNFGVTTEFDYPYVSGTNSQAVYECKTQTGYFKVASYSNIQQGNCQAVKIALQKKPLSVGIASYRLQFYQNGTFTDCDSHLDHAVLLVGYSAAKGWKIKNTWGVDWGMSGYAWISQTNNCGICQAAIQPHLSSQTSVVPLMALSALQRRSVMASITALQPKI